MAESSPEGTVKAIWHVIIPALGAALAWLAGWTGIVGTVLATLLAITVAICGLVFSLMYRRYVGVLASGAKRKGSPERNAYDALRENLEAGGLPNRLYAGRLTAFLDAVDRFFGDAGMADRTLFPHAFGLKTPAPLWTAPAFDRCLLLALIYPIATILVIWAVSGHVGPAEAALGLEPSLTGWHRGLGAALAGSTCFALWQVTQTRRWKFFGWNAIAFAAVIASAVAIGSSAIFVVFFAGLSIAFTVMARVRGTGAVAIAITLSALVFAAVISGSRVHALPDGGSIALVVAFFIITLRVAVVMHRHQGRFLSLIVLVMILACLGARWLLPMNGRQDAMMLFVGLLTLLNAPFDWASLGLTRALLRRGLELGAWWPFLLALADAILAGVIIALLALTMVIGVQAFDDLAAHGGGKPVLPLGPFFDGIAAHPMAPEFWWVYALLFSTMIPSLINLMIGGASLMRGVPGVPYLLVRKMPVGKAVPTFDRTWMALVLALQWVGGVVLGVIVQLLAVVAVIGYVKPWLGLGLLDVARDVAALDLPARLGRVLAGIL